MTGHDHCMSGHQTLPVCKISDLHLLEVFEIAIGIETVRTTIRRIVCPILMVQFIPNFIMIIAIYHSAVSKVDYNCVNQNLHVYRKNGLRHRPSLYILP